MSDRLADVVIAYIGIALLVSVIVAIWIYEGRHDGQ